MPRTVIFPAPALVLAGVGKFHFCHGNSTPDSPFSRLGSEKTAAPKTPSLTRTSGKRRRGDENLNKGLDEDR